MTTTRTRTLYPIAKRTSDRSPLVWPVAVLSSLVIEGAIIAGVVLYCRAKGWM